MRAVKNYIRGASPVEAGTVILLFLCGLLPRILFTGASPSGLVRVVPDDAFYYMRLAQSVVSGHGATVDGVHITNGYHPLWLVLLLPLAATIHSPWTLVRAALLAGTVCGMLTAYFLFRTVRAVTGRWWIAAAAAGIYLLDPRAILYDLNGMETAVCTLLFTVCLSFLLRRYAGSSAGLRQSPWEAAIWGAVLGLLVMARTDMALYAVPFALLALAPWAYRRAWRLVVALSGTTVAVILPWLAWNWLHFHAIIQASASAVPYVLHGWFLSSGHSAAQAAALGFDELRTFVRSGLWADIGLPAWGSLGALVIIVAALLLPRDRTARSGEKASRQFLLLVLVPWVSAATLIVIHALVRWYPREYYFDHIIVLNAVMFAAALAVVDAWTRAFVQRVSFVTWQRSTSVLGIVGLILVLVTLSGIAILDSRTVANGIYPAQDASLAAGEWVRAHLPARAIVGGFDSGMVGYVARQQVVDLDGVANNAVFAAIQRQDLLGEMCASGVRYFVDWDPIMRDLYAPYWGHSHAVMWVPLRSFRSRATAAVIQLYRLDWPATARCHTR